MRLELELGQHVHSAQCTARSQDLPLHQPRCVSERPDYFEHHVKTSLEIPHPTLSIALPSGCYELSNIRFTAEQTEGQIRE